MNNVFQIASDYYKASHLANLYCGVISAEASLRGLIHLVKAVCYLAMGILKNREENLLNASKEFIECGQDALYAAIYGFGAINPIAGIAVPTVAMTASAMSVESSQDSLSNRYTLNAVLDFIPTKLIKGAIEQLTATADVSSRIGTITIGALVAFGAFYALGVSLPVSLPTVRWLPVKLTFG